MNIKTISKRVAACDCCMMTTVGKNGELHSRPMLHNKTLEINDTLYFFSMKNAMKIHDLDSNPVISLTYQQSDKGGFIQIYGNGYVEDNPEKMAPHWDKQLDAWWPGGAHTEGICMIRVEIKWIRYWFDGNDEMIVIAR